MQKTLRSATAIALCLLLQVLSVSAQTAYFDKRGNPITAEQYAQIAAQHTRPDPAAVQTKTIISFPVPSAPAPQLIDPLPQIPTAPQAVSTRGAYGGEVCRVSSVVDGDTLTVSCLGSTTERIRLCGVDSPEGGQAHGVLARQFTAAMTQGRYVRVRRVDRDRYGRAIAWVYVDGKSLNEEILRRGLAWHFKQYSSDAGLAALEVAARATREGIWSDPASVAPWDYRAEKEAPAARIAKQSVSYDRPTYQAPPSTRKLNTLPRTELLFSPSGGSSMSTSPSNSDGRGCCSSHGGISRCEGGRWKCKDGSFSPTCGC